MCWSHTEKDRKTLADNKTAGGQGHLTNVMIDKIQNYYGQAIRNNQDLYSMKNAIWTIFYHVCNMGHLSPCNTIGRKCNIRGTT